MRATLRGLFACAAFAAYIASVAMVFANDVDVATFMLLMGLNCSWWAKQVGGGE